MFLCFIVVVLGALLVADIDEAMNKMSAGQLLEVGASLVASLYQPVNFAEPS